jgi:hypothetical protein
MQWALWVDTRLLLLQGMTKMQEMAWRKKNKAGGGEPRHKQTFSQA